MGQKINPLSFRSVKGLNLQNDKWFIPINNFNYQILVHQDFEIKLLVTNFLKFKNIYIHKILINRYHNTLILNLEVFDNNIFDIYNDKNYNDIKYIQRKNINKKYLIFLLKKNLQLNDCFNLTLNIKELFKPKIKSGFQKLNKNSKDYIINKYNSEEYIQNNLKLNKNALKEYFKKLNSKPKLTFGEFLEDVKRFRRIKHFSGKSILEVKELIFGNKNIKFRVQDKFDNNKKKFKIKKQFLNKKINLKKQKHLNDTYKFKKIEGFKSGNFKYAQNKGRYQRYKKKFNKSFKKPYIQSIFKKNFRAMKVIKLIQTSLFKYKNYKKFSSILDLMFIIFKFKSSEILLHYLIKNLKYSLKKKQFTFIMFTKNILKQYFINRKKITKKICGLKIQIKGKINSSNRTKTQIFNYGRTPLQTIKLKVNYGFQNFVNKDGMFGVKVWFFYN